MRQIHVILDFKIKTMEKTFTITFGDAAENHVGMRKIGQLAIDGFDLNNLSKAYYWFQEKGIETYIYDLSASPRPLYTDYNFEDAYILIAKNGLSAICNTNDFMTEQDKLEKDTKAYMYGRVVNKKARHNLCFDDIAVSPNYEIGQGTIISYDAVPLLNQVRNILPEIIGDKAFNLKAEGNYYYDITKCGIGFHGDSERKRVIGIRSGASMPLVYSWFYKSKPIGSPMEFILDNGDIYIMSSYSVGTNWKKKNVPTLRHAAGCKKFTTL